MVSTCSAIKLRWLFSWQWNAHLFSRERYCHARKRICSVFCRITRFSIYSSRFTERSWKIIESLKVRRISLRMCTNDKEHYSGRRRVLSSAKSITERFEVSTYQRFGHYLLQDSTSFNFFFILCMEMHGSFNNKSHNNIGSVNLRMLLDFNLYLFSWSSLTKSFDVTKISRYSQYWTV